MCEHDAKGKFAMPKGNGLTAFNYSDLWQYGLKGAQ